MSHVRSADVVVVADGDSEEALRCLEGVLEHSGPALHRLIVVVASPLHGKHHRGLETMAASDSRVRLVLDFQGKGEVTACNRGLAERAANVVLLQSDIEVTPGWLDELAMAAYSGARTACACPLMNHGERTGVPAYDTGDQAAVLDSTTVRSACEHLPRWSVVPVLTGFCCYLRGEVVDAVGLLDPAYDSVAVAASDWVMRAQVLGFVAKRANHAVVNRVNPSGFVSFVDYLHDRDQERLAKRHSHLQPQLDRFKTSLERSLASHAIRLRSTGKLRIAYDLRYLTREQVGTRTLAVSLVKALAELPEVDLTLLVRDPVQAQGLRGRVVTSEHWLDDAQVIHRPAQVIDPRDLRLLFESSAHLIITYQDLIGYRIPQVFTSDAEFHLYRATSCLCLQGVQRILASSQSAAQEIVEEFGVPEEEVVVVPLGVDAAWFSNRDPQNASIFRRLKLPRRYFFSVATDFPHKNLPCLLEAYSRFRTEWTLEEAPPAMVMAGYATGARGGLYEQLELQPEAENVVFLGPVSVDELRVLYQSAEALVFPSLYEGFGLPPLEAMAAGVPVIAMPISAVPEVGGDCVLYPDGLSAEALARAMGRLASDDVLRARLRARGLERVGEFSWERTAQATLDVYRSTVLHPAPRSLAMRRRLRDAILSWSDSVSYLEVVGARPLGIRSAWQALGGALHRRFRREISRLRPASRRRSA
jgi:glycosyltransferase involved in cell wall biosynthesis